eukprot:734844-Prymnesium_polylepis.1
MKAHVRWRERQQLRVRPQRQHVEVGEHGHVSRAHHRRAVGVRLLEKRQHRARLREARCDPHVVTKAAVAASLDVCGRQVHVHCVGVVLIITHHLFDPALPAAKHAQRGGRAVRVRRDVNFGAAARKERGFVLCAQFVVLHRRWCVHHRCIRLHPGPRLVALVEDVRARRHAVTEHGCRSMPTARSGFAAFHSRVAVYCMQRLRATTR